MRRFALNLVLLSVVLLASPSPRIGYVSVDHEPSPRTRVLLVSRRLLDYHTALVPGDPNGETRGSDSRRYATRFFWSFNPALNSFTGLGLQRTDSPDPIHAHDRDWLMSGIRYRMP